MRLTFVKDFDCYEGSGAGYNMADVVPCTIEGEMIEDVVSCKVESRVGMIPRMTITVLVREHISDAMANRLKGNKV